MLNAAGALATLEIGAAQTGMAGGNVGCGLPECGEEWRQGWIFNASPVILLGKIQQLHLIEALSAAR